MKVSEELKVPIILLFDEGNILAQSRVLLQKLRTIFMNTPGFMLVMTGTPDLFPVMDDVFSPIVRQFKKINVGEFRNVEDTGECINKPLEKLDINFKAILTNSDVQEIHKLSGGRPYEIQLICHMLFRRLQLRRADNMKLDFSVLEEVRRELETWQDITSRPILTKVRNLSKKQLDALRILCSCNGRATFDQVWGLEYIFKGEASWKKDTLEMVFRHYLDYGILRVDNDLISFAGDDFDKIYAKYLAREKDIRLNFSSYSLESRWQIVLRDFIVLHLKDRLKTMPFPNQLSFMDILNVIHEIAAQQSDEDVFVDKAELSQNLYMLMVEYQDQTAMPVIAINPGLTWLNLQLFFRPKESSDFEAVEEGVKLTQSLGERIAILGGNLVVERLELPIVPFSTLADKVENTANERYRKLLAQRHALKMQSAYNEKADREEAFLHANISYRYDSQPDSKRSNNIGYVFFGSDDLDRAEVLFKRSISLSQTDKSDDPAFPALPMYNLGVLQAQRGQLENAQANFNSCIDLVYALNSEDRSVLCLWVPVMKNEVLIFEERTQPEILETAEEAKATIGNIVDHKVDE
jgi:hypothetical protein